MRPKNVGSSKENGIKTPHRMYNDFIADRVENKYARIKIPNDSPKYKR